MNDCRLQIEDCGLSAVDNPKSEIRNPKCARRGMAVVLVLGLLALTLTLSYAMLRMEYQVEQSQTNISGLDKARLAAVTGISVALRKMHDGTWAGVDTTLHGSLGSGVVYDVGFATGDPSLTSSHPSYGEYPYRVTLSSIGTAVDPAQPNAQVTYRVQTVAQLTRRQLNAATTPSRWSQLNTYTVYQWNASSTPRDMPIELPCQIRGNACFEGRLRLCQAYPKYQGSRERYLKDLKLFAQAGTDYRPFTGTVALDNTRQSGGVNSELTDWLGVNVVGISGNSSVPLTFPSGVTTYQLFSGGKVYAIPRLQDVLITPAKNQILAPDPLTNPLGVFRTDGNWNFMMGSKLTGTLLCENSTAVITLSGTGVQLSGMNLPNLEGSSASSQLPLAIVKNDVVAASSSISTINGLVIAWNQFVVSAGTKGTMLTLTGRVFADGFGINARTEWNAVSEVQWQQSLNDFLAQYNPLLFPLGLSEQYYPRWMERSPYLLVAAPKLNFAPPTNVTYHWPNWSQPIYVKADGDAGLRWNLVSWGESSQ